MIGYFPSPYPDEIFYSVVARFASRMKYPAPYLVLQEIFGSQVKASIGFPSRLNHLIDSLPSVHSLSADQLIVEHTLLPLYAPFLPPERIEHIESGMRGERTQGINLLLGGGANSAPSNEFVRYCPICVEEDRQQYGEAYWHRSHLVNGLSCCPKHGVTLQKSVVVVTAQREFIAAEDVVDDLVQTSELTFTDEQQTVREIAESATWLLNQTGLVGEFNHLRDRYIHHLIPHGFATHSGSVRIKELQEAFKARYDHEFLLSLGCELDGRHKRNWLATIAQSTNVHHPLRHLLLMNFLGVDAKTFFGASLSLKPFDQGPYPCLNKVCEHYQQPIIEQVQIGFSRSQHRHPSGTFICPVCGYTYKRVGPDTEAEDIYRGKVIDYGHLWRERLKEVWFDVNLRQKDKARIMGVGQDTLKRHVYKLGLIDGVTTLASDKSLDELRLQWMNLVDDNPNVGVAGLIELAPNIYWKLYNLDAEWLSAHKPIIAKKQNGKSVRVDWQMLDKEYVEQIQQVLPTFQEKGRRPVRITANALGNAIGLRDAHLTKNRHRLPLTTALLENIVESHEQFALRRIHYVRQLCENSGETPSKWQFIKMTGLSKSIQSDEIIQEVENAIKTLADLQRRT